MINFLQNVVNLKHLLVALLIVRRIVIVKYIFVKLKTHNVFTNASARWAILESTHQPTSVLNKVNAYINLKQRSSLNGTSLTPKIKQKHINF